MCRQPSTSALTVLAAIALAIGLGAVACGNQSLELPLPTSIASHTPAPTPWPEPRISVIADGLLSPIGMAELPNGALLVAEDGTGHNDDSAGVSLIEPGGQVGRFLSGLPSNRDSGDLAGSPLVAVSPAGDTLYVGNFGQGHLWTLPLTQDQQNMGLELPETPGSVADWTPAMHPLNNVRLTNPFGITFDPSDVPVVTDASGDGVAKENPDGTTRFIHRFAPLRTPGSSSRWNTISPVPTGIARIGDEYYVTLTGGCPFPDGGGQLVAIDEQRNQRTVVDGLNMPIDVAQGPDGTIWVLEFARFTPNASCFSGSGYRQKTGRLSRLAPDGALIPVLEDLNFPGAVLPRADGSLYISEVFPGRVLHIVFGDGPVSPLLGTAGDLDPVLRPEPEPDPPPAVKNADGRLLEVIQAANLSPFPGADVEEEDPRLVQLGHELFFDPILSGDQNISCATCHHPRFAGGDGRVLPIGTGGHGLGPERAFVDRVKLGTEADYLRRLSGETDPWTGETWVANPFEGQFVPRNTPTILNSALLPVQFWDGRVESYATGSQVQTLERTVNAMGMTDALATQAVFPITSLHEMAGATFGSLPPQTIRRRLLERLQSTPAYVQRFQQVFGPTDDPSQAITLARLAAALAAFERSLTFTASPWDHYLAGDQEALNEPQKQGALLFFGQARPQVNCAGCHSGDLFTDLQYHNLLVPQLGPGKGHSYTKREDWGRAAVTFDLRDRYKFRTPSLRNVDLTAPYFHDGAFATLEAAIEHHGHIWNGALAYDPSANGIPPAHYSSLRAFEPRKQWPTAAEDLRDGLPLAAADIADLVAFLEALTDPRARDLEHLLLEQVPSGLPVDPLPSGQPQRIIPNPAVLASPIEPSREAATGNLGAFRFTDVADSVGLDFRQGSFRTGVFEDPAAAMGGGLCWIDYDNDGWLDLYLVNTHAKDEIAYWQTNGGLPRNQLYRNQQGTFVNVSEASGTDLALRGNGCVAADFNGDGWMDLLVTVDGPNALLWNNGDGTFSEGAGAAGIAAPEWNSAAAVGDLNGDGLPDLFLASYIDLDHKVPRPIGAFPQDYYGLPDRLYINLGPTGADRVTFREVTRLAGLEREERSLGAIFSDLDDDGDLDLYIANDGHPNRLYANHPWPGGAAADPAEIGFRLVDVTDIAQVGDSGSGMGVAVGDYDGDGRLDLFITNWERELNALYRNESSEATPLTFQYSTFRIGVAGLGNGLTGWGTHLADFDLDTDTDLLIVNGRVPVTNLQTDPEPIRFYRNRSRNPEGSPGHHAQFLDWTQQVGLKEVGPILGRGSAVADFDNDGDLDVAINVIAGPAVLLRNHGPPGHWLTVVLDGFFPGARATAVLPDGRRLMREIHAGSSYLASEDGRLHFGLGPNPVVPQLIVRWPDGRQQILHDVQAGQHLHVQPPPQ